MPRSAPMPTASFTTHRNARPVMALAQKLMIAIGGVFLLILAVTWLTISTSVESLLADHAVQYGSNLASLAANSVAEALIADDELQLSVLSSTLTRDPALRGAALYNLNGVVRSSDGHVGTFSLDELRSLALAPSLPAKAVTVPFAAPVFFHNTQVGYLLLMLDRETLERPIRSSMHKISVAIIAMMALACVAAYWLGQRLALPIDRLAVATRVLREGRYDEPIHVRREDEIGEIIHTLNDMAQSLQRKLQSERSLSRFVSPALAHNIIHGHDDQMLGRNVYASVMFLDMVGFTSLSEKLAPQQVADLLNRYFAILNRVVKLYNGNVDKYIGDGAMVVFGAPRNDEEHGFHALACARLFLQITKTLREQQTDDTPPVHFHIGVHCGDMIAGSMGSEDRMQYTVVGDAVNLAARLCEVSPADEIWLSADLLQHNDVRNRIEVAPRGSVVLKGKSHPTECFHLQQLQLPYEQLLTRQIQHLLGHNGGLNL